MADDLTKRYMLTKQAVDKIAAVVKMLENEVKALRGRPNSQIAPAGVPLIVGTLNGSLTRGSLSAPTTAAVSVYVSGSALGDAWSDTTVNIDIVDVGMFPSSKSPIASGTKVQAAWMGGKYVLIGADIC